MQRIRRWWWLLLFIPVLLAGGFVIWAVWTPAPMPEAEAALQATLGTDGVLVSTDGWLTFRPITAEPSTGLILYPGGRVAPEAYAPTAREIAAEGYLVIVAPMPLNLAFFAPGRAAVIMASHPEITQWVVGGHSLGGAMSARFAHRNPSAVDGLVLWAAYPAESDDLSEQDLAVTSIYGTRDGLATPEKIDASRPLLPPTAEWVAVEGGNHAQFGWYGSQNADRPATISREAQQDEVIAATVRLLQQVGR